MAVSAWGKAQPLTPFHDVFFGEHTQSDYFGPVNPSQKLNSSNGEVRSEDDRFNEEFIIPYVTNSFEDLLSVWFDSIPWEKECPNYVFSKNLEYIRYLYRLITISYLFETLAEYNLILHQIGYSRNVCSISYNQVFGKCYPKNNEMKKFLMRIKNRHLDDVDLSKYNKLNSKDRNNWLSDSYQKIKNNQIDSPITLRLSQYCSNKKGGCNKISAAEVKDIMSRSCNNEKRLIRSVCSENDRLFGISDHQQATLLIQRSNAINVLEKDGYGVGCLRRFVKVFRSKEKKYNELDRLFPTIMKMIVSSHKRYLQGSLFTPGALKEFDDAGLEDFMVRATPTPKPRKTAKPFTVVSKVEIPLLRPTVAPTPIPTPEPTAEPTPEATPKPSEFAIAVAEKNRTNSERVPVDMDIFRDDFVFSDKMLVMLSDPLREYQTRVALEEMRKFDKLGQKVEPVRLIFLKYLIDFEFHQGLYNISAILGNKFWVKNDIDKAKVPEYIEMRNERSTNFRWQIYILQGPDDSKEK